MELSIYLARAWGVFAMVASLALYLNRERFKDMVGDLKRDNISILIAGVIALAMGVLQVVGFNQWTFDYKGLITLFGWLSLLKGVTILFLPGRAEGVAKSFVKGNTYTTLLAVFFVLGLYLAYIGFMM